VKFAIIFEGEKIVLKILDTNVKTGGIYRLRKCLCDKYFCRFRVYSLFIKKNMMYETTWMPQDVFRSEN